MCIQTTPFSCECWSKYFYPEDPESAVGEGSYGVFKTSYEPVHCNFQRVILTLKVELKF